VRHLTCSRFPSSPTNPLRPHALPASVRPHPPKRLILTFLDLLDLHPLLTTPKRWRTKSINPFGPALVGLVSRQSCKQSALRLPAELHRQTKGYMILVSLHSYWTYDSLPFSPSFICTFSVHYPATLLMSTICKVLTPSGTLNVVFIQSSINLKTSISDMFAT
jgi:hypothetical protein